MAEAEAVLRVEHLTVQYDRQPVIRDLSFDVHRGDRVMILGPNGAGKTTLFRALLGFIPYSGRIWWDPAVTVGFVPQGLDVNRKFPVTVAELFRFGKVRVADAAVVEELTLVNAAALAHRSLATLSAGEFQRVLIAFALAQKPDVLLFDEPTSDIDIGGQETVYQRLETIAAERALTLLMISHDLNVVLRYATEVLCLNRDFRCHGAPRDILTPEVLRDLYGQNVQFYQHTHSPAERHEDGADLRAGA
ncbi:MAG TPA: metal ABC transporter ATP-binding protein [Vicinamibacterales bacterium]|nr:metal ABC transporter ATP-binding protein [Vicinamibacterales bacterium]